MMGAQLSRALADMCHMSAAALQVYPYTVVVVGQGQTG